MAVLKYQVNGEWHSLPTGATYEVGDIFISTNATSPAARFGGTWTQLTDRFLVGAGSSYAAGAMGGEATHTLTVNEMPKHSHVFMRQQWYTHDSIIVESSGTIFSWKSSTGGATSQGFAGDANDYGPTGGSAAHNNIPPYMAVYMWLRTA